MPRLAVIRVHQVILQAAPWLRLPRKDLAEKALSASDLGQAPQAVALRNVTFQQDGAGTWDFTAAHQPLGRDPRTGKQQRGMGSVEVGWLVCGWFNKSGCLHGDGGIFDSCASKTSSTSVAEIRCCRGLDGFNCVVRRVWFYQLGLM